MLVHTFFFSSKRGGMQRHYKRIKHPNNKINTFSSIYHLNYTPDLLEKREERKLKHGVIKPNSWEKKN